MVQRCSVCHKRDRRVKHAFVKARTARTLWLIPQPVWLHRIECCTCLTCSEALREVTRTLDWVEQRIRQPEITEKELDRCLRYMKWVREVTDLNVVMSDLMGTTQTLLGVAERPPYIIQGW